ncbi:gluconate kinase, FGGY family [Alkalibacterium putridalgicola]|uniref:Gluconate kinase n=1 Tax=Alkalibacterium putridalgicola TaxID=426703 RepID=A0A1H7QKY9_9LACT|nr:gluconokinase [Alkalibacterium putridalgicola]GEK88436.1 gluconate kinase [Alkalibacterium putridalgicola]SEL48265.1 gluconate kinase, FGGY family [Alkalibacterium putridalgicola]
MSHYSIGADIGTTSTKAVLFSSEGDIVHQATVEYPLLTPEPKAAEQDPDEIVEAVVTAIQSVMANSGVDKKDITVLSFSAAMHSLIAVDAKGKPLTKSLTWADQRAEPYARQLKETNGKAIYDKTGTPIHPMSPLTKLMWLKAEQPDIFNKASRFIGIKEYVFYHFFNKYVVDHSIASATGLLNMYELDWDKEALETAGVTKDRLSELVPTTAVFTDMDPELAERMGIHPDMKVVIGANDGCLANLGVNAIENGVVAVSIGTSGAIRTVTDKPVSDPKGRIFCYALTEDHWVIGGPVNNGGMILRWLRDELCAEEVSAAKAQACDPYDLITEKIAKISAGSNGLLFHPYLSGERAPSWNANARGSFYGLAMHHKREHMMRAVLEGINMNLYMVLLALEEVIGIPDRIHATGGFAKSPVWRQMMANIFNQEVHVPQTVEGACLGAAVLGKYAIGEIDDLTEVRHMVETKEITVPEAEEVAVYEELMPLYIRLSRLFEEEYDAITAFQQKYK